jgi:hypothetical protein
MLTYSDVLRMINNFMSYDDDKINKMLSNYTKEQVVSIYKMCLVARNKAKYKLDILRLMMYDFKATPVDVNEINNKLCEVNNLENVAEKILDFLGEYEIKTDIHLT